MQSPLELIRVGRRRRSLVSGDRTSERPDLSLIRVVRGVSGSGPEAYSPKQQPLAAIERKRHVPAHAVGI
jgi:hypothetical protein